MQDYTITSDSKIGGVYSVVCTAINSRQQKFAAKRILAHDPQSLKESFTVTQDLVNDHLVRPLGLLEDSKNKFYLITQLAESNLAELINKQIAEKSRLTFNTIMNIVGQIVNGLRVLHSSGMIHGNLKPSNILVYDPLGNINVQLMDFEGYPGVDQQRQTGKMTYATRLIQSLEFL